MIYWMCVRRLYYLRIALQDVSGCFKKFVMTKAFGSVRTTTALWDQGDLKSQGFSLCCDPCFIAMGVSLILLLPLRAFVPLGQGLLLLNLWALAHWSQVVKCDDMDVETMVTAKCNRNVGQIKGELELLVLTM